MSKIVLLQARSVLVRNKEASSAMPGAQLFQPQVDDDVVSRLSVVVMQELWEDLGKPNRITVAVQSGDRLNEG